MASDDLEEQQRLLAKEYEVHLAGELKKLSNMIGRLTSSNSAQTSLNEVLHLAHKLAGSAPSFGYKNLGKVAGELEAQVKPLIRQKATPEPATLKKLQDTCARLQPLFDEEKKAQASILIPSDLLQTRKIQAVRPVYLVEKDKALGQEIATQLGHFGYQLSTYHNVEEANEAIKSFMPSAVVIDVDLALGLSRRSKQPGVLQLAAENDCPLVFISRRNDWNARLGAVRAGGSAFLVKPVSVQKLVSHLDRLLLESEQEPYRILIVDDDIKLAEHYALVLRQAGMQVQTLNMPDKLLRAVVDFRPELIMMDLHMPAVTGAEAARVVRQHEQLFSIPVVFLSTEQNREEQLNAMDQGDNFLQKPIIDAHLAKVISQRAKRARALGALMYYDGLTGLLNHTSLKQHLETEVARAKRQNRSLCFVLADLDLFKAVNDNYGHSAGDEVLKSLARLLQERLRKVDIIGRYGGEEFGIILPDTEIEIASALLEDLLLLFSSISHISGNQEYKCTFSAGVASVEQSTSAKQLVDAADAALYQAKQQGRNQIAIYRPEK